MRSRMRQLVGDQRKRIVAIGFLAILSGFAEAINLALLAQIAATLVRANSVHAKIILFHIRAPTKTLLIAGFVLAIVRLVFLQVPLTLLPARITTISWGRIRMNLFEAYSGASWELQSREREGRLQEIMTNQAAYANGALGSLLGLVNATLTFIVLLVFACVINVVAAVIVLALALSMLALLRPLRTLSKRRARALSRAQVNYAAGIAEANRIAEEAHVFGAGDALRRRVDGLVAISRRLLFQNGILGRIGSNISETYVYVLLLGALFVLYKTGAHHIASLGAVVLILLRASSSGEGIQSAYQSLIQAMPYVELVQETERRYRESSPPAGTYALPRVSGLAFDDVGYAYTPGRPVLSGVSFEVNGGEVIGVIGPSGAGKSTLVQLLLRLRAPSEGGYLVNGIPAQEFLQEDWHTRVAYVPQEPRLLHASVADNIRFFREIDDDAVQRAAELARIHEDIVGWAEGYETIVGPRADAVSGGQQQRICLARALAAKPEVLVLDEPTSALDPTSESLIQESLTGLKQQLTLFIIAHRMSTHDICDRVMIIIDGKLTAFDTIDFLQQNNSYYRSASKIAARGSLV
jgi:ATP-binding cassette subfamily B protein